jgi:hypothetical protein
MGKNLGEIINNIMEENASNRVVILTEKLHITGSIHDYHDKCQNCHDCLISLQDVKISRLKDLVKCSEDECDCHEESYAHYEWFNINTAAIVGFSIINSME